MRKIVSGVALWGMAIVAGFSVHSSFAGAQWPSYQFDAANSGKSPYAGVTNPTLRWTFHVNANLWASSAIGPDGTIYFGAQDATLYALGKNGKLKWKFTSADAQYSAKYGGIDHAPAVDDSGYVYFGTAGGLVYCLTPSGAVGWRIKVEGEVSTDIKLAPDGAVCFGTLSGEIGGRIYVVKGGNVIWTYATEPIVGSSPAIAPNGTMYFGVPVGSLFGGDTGMLCAVAPPGVLLWTAAVESPIVSAPALDKEGNVYCATGAGVLRKYNSSGVPLWTAATEYLKEYQYTLEVDGVPPFLQSSSPVVTDSGRVIYCADKLYCYLTSGKPLWTYQPYPYYVHGSPITDTYGNIYCMGNGDITCLDPEGKPKWKYDKAKGACYPMQHTFAMDSSGWIYFASYGPQNTVGDNIFALGPLDLASLSISRPWTQQDFMLPKWTPPPLPAGMNP